MGIATRKDRSPPLLSERLLQPPTSTLRETIKYLDYLFSEDGQILVNYGVEGEDYTLQDGKPVFTDKVLNNTDNFVMGTESLDGFDQFVAGIQKMGINEILSMYSETYEKYDEYNK